MDDRLRAMPRYGTEYEGLRLVLPRTLLTSLFFLAAAFGVCLCVIVPTGLFARALAELDRAQELSAAWFLFLATLSLLVLVRWCAIQMAGFLDYWRLRNGPPDQPAVWPLVSILVPAYQESETIVSALRSLVELDYPHYEIIVVDDGSTDDTYDKALAFVGSYGHCELRLFRKPNGGKWSALNFAFAEARGDLLLCIDADSRLSKDALRYLVLGMRDPAVSGVSGQITVRNRKSLLARLQALEYVVSNGGLRAAQSLLGMVLVVPGPIGMYRRSALEDVTRLAGQPRSEGYGHVDGPLSHETFAEDFQLSLSILALGGRIVYEPRARSYTKSPEFTHTLLNQRYRWFRGSMQVLKIYRARLRKLPGNRHRLTALVAGLYLLDLYLLPIVSFGAIFGAVVAAIASGNVGILLLWASVVWLLNGMSSALHIFTQGDDPTLLALVPLYDMYHGLLLNGAWLIALMDEARRTKMQW